MIRVLTPDDLDAYRALWIFGLREDPLAFLLTFEEAIATPDAALIAKLMAGDILGAFDGDVLVGLVALRRGGPVRLQHMADLGPLYVHPQARKRGLARALMQAAEEVARDWGVLQMELCVDARNSGARQLYTSCGFEQIGLRRGQ